MLIMKKTFTKLSGAVLVLSLSFAGIANAQQTTFASVAKISKNDAKADSAASDNKAAAPAAKAEVKKADDAAWTPVRRLWGYTFGDLYFDPHAAKSTSMGPETMYNGVPTNRNAFQFRRIYLGYDYDINQKFSAQVLLASEPNANTGTASGTTISSGDNLVDNKMGFFIKNFNLRVRDLWKGTDLVIGEMSTPGFALNESGSNAPTSLSEATWSYRFIEKTITDFHKNNSYDVGAALQGTFDPSTKNFGYVVMVGNNTQSNLTSAANANTGFYKIVYADIWGKFLDKHLYVDIYGNHAQTGPSVANVGKQDNDMFKVFAAYTVPVITVGAEAYTQTLSNALNIASVGGQNATVQGLSLFARGPIVKDKLGWFARYDTYNPDKNFKTANPYERGTTATDPKVYTNYGSFNPDYKEQFYTAGLDFTPAPKIHFSPNVWIVNYKDQRDKSVAGSGFVGNDHTVVLRATFYYTFGK